MNLVSQLLGRIGEKRKRVVVIGDAMYDRWVDCTIADCQDGCQKYVSSEVVETKGGAANAERCLVDWGVGTRLHTYSTRWPEKHRFCVDGKIVYRWDNEVKQESSYWAQDYVLEKLAHADAVLLSDYDKGYLTPEFIGRVSERCRELGLPCVADCKRPPSTYPGCVLKCNTDYQRQYNDELSDATERGQQLVVTAGKLNPVVWTDGAPWGLGYDLPKVPCVNHVGAGDCFAAHLTLALAYGFSLQDAMKLAHSAGRVYVQHPHNRPPYVDEIKRDLLLRVAP